MKIEQLLRQINKRLDAIEHQLKSEDNRMLTTKQAAEILGCTSSALRMRANRGNIACSKSPTTGRLYFRKSDIQHEINL